MTRARAAAPRTRAREDRQFVTALARGLEILRCFTPEGPILGNKDLCKLGCRWFSGSSRHTVKLG